MTLAPSGRSRRRQVWLAGAGAMLVAAVTFGNVAQQSTASADDTGLASPTARGINHNAWQRGHDAYASDNKYAFAETEGAIQSFEKFGFSLPPTATIAGVEVFLEAHVERDINGGCRIEARLYNTGEASHTAWQGAELTTSDAVYMLGGPTDEWGLSGAWRPSDFADDHFHVEVQFDDQGPGNTCRDAGATVYLDHIQVRVHFSEAETTAQTATTVTCAPTPVLAGAATTCTATVSSEAATPEGEVAFATAADGTFGSNRCVLVAGSCSVTYTPSSAATSPHTLEATYVPASNHQGSGDTTQVAVLPDADGDGVADGEDTCPETPAGAAVDGAGCPSRTIRIMKVVEHANGGTPPMAGFSGTIAPHSPGSWDIDTSVSAIVEIADVSGSTAQTITEAAPGGDWTFGGYWAGVGLLDSCASGEFEGDRENGVLIPADGQAYTVCIRNVYAPPNVVLAKVVAEDETAPSDAFAVTIAQTDGPFSRTLTIRAEDGPVPVEVTSGTFTIEERDPATVGAGYVVIGYSVGALEDDGSVACDPTTTPPPTIAVEAGDVAVVCIHNRAAALPTVRKEALGFAGGVAAWRITIDNRGTDAIARTVRVTDPGVALTDGAGCTQEEEVITCEVDADRELSFEVTRPIAGAACADREIGNAAGAAVVTASGTIDLGSTGIAAVSIPGDPDVCDLPLLEKVSSGYGDGGARWTITIDNRVPDAGPQTVVVRDPDVVLVSVDGDCAPASPGDAVDGVRCAIAPGGVVTLVVERAEHPSCDPRTVSNVAEAHALSEGGALRALQGSPSLPSSVTVPGSDAECPSQIVVRKLFDDGDGQPGPTDVAVNGWDIAVTCDGVPLPGSPDTTGTHRAGTVMFTVPAPAGGKTCTVTEATALLVRTVGHAVNGGPFEPGSSTTITLAGRDQVTVVFLNEPVGLVAPEPNGADAVVPRLDPRHATDGASSPAREPQAPENEPTPPPAEAPPAGDGTGPLPSPAEGDGAPPAEATPAPPAAGSGVASGPTGEAWPAVVAILAALAFVIAHHLAVSARRR